MLTTLIFLIAIALTAWITWFVANLFLHEKERSRVAYIEMLRNDTGASVTLLCDNEDAETPEQNFAVEVCAEWTGWEARRFYGTTLNRALSEAAMSRIRGRKPGML